MEYTYKNKYGIRNSKKRVALKGPKKGQITKWLTKDGKIVIYPDQFFSLHGDMKFERIPFLTRLFNRTVKEP